MHEPQLVERLLPHRAPFLMIDTVVEFAGGNSPRLAAEFSIRRSEPIFSGLEPPLRWPPLYVVEGLAQCSSLLSAIRWWETHYAALGLGEDGFHDTFLSPKADDPTADPWAEAIHHNLNTTARTGMLASVDVEITGTVDAGDLLRYDVEQKRVVRGLCCFAVCASVENTTVAKGTLVGARLDGGA